MLTIQDFKVGEFRKITYKKEPDLWYIVKITCVSNIEEAIYFQVVSASQMRFWNLGHKTSFTIDTINRELDGYGWKSFDVYDFDAMLSKLEWV